MPFYKKAFSKRTGVYYPRAIVQGKPVETETIAKDLAKISTVSNSDVQAVLGDIAGVMHTRMSQGKSVHIKGLGYFRYTLDTVGVKDAKEFNFQKQVKSVHVEFIPERTQLSGGTYTRALVDSDDLEWIELSPETEDSTPGGEDGGGYAPSGRVSTAGTAWHPSGTDPEQWKVKADQSTADGYQASDLIKGELTLSFADRNVPDKNTMNFLHQTAKLEIRLLAGKGVTLSGNITVRLLGVSGVENNGDEITAYRPNAGEQTYLTLLNGQTIESRKRFIQVRVNDIDYTYRPWETQELKAGTVYTYEITVNAKELGVKVTESIDWNTEDGAVGDDVIPLS